MIQLNVLTGKQAGTQWVAGRFPFQVGRAAADALVLDDPGVWEQHFNIDVDSTDGVVLSASPDAFTTVNGQTVLQTVLRSGDIIEAGSVKLRFALSPTRQTGLRLREILTWTALGALCLGQVALIYWLME